MLIVEYRIENAGGAFFEIDGSALRQARPSNGGQAQERLLRIWGIVLGMWE